MNIFWYILLGIIAFLPIVLWGYSFAFISDNPLNKKRFLVGIFAGIVSVFPIFYMEGILKFFQLENFHVFYALLQIKSFFTSMSFSVSLALFLVIIVFLSFIIGVLFVKKKEQIGLYLKIFFIFLFLVFGIGLLFFIISLIPFDVDIQSTNVPIFSGILFNTFKLLIFYYVVVAFVEEASKHFNFLQTSAFEIKDIKSGVESAIFVALGFSFVENILYLHNYIMQYEIGGPLFQLYFFRSVFAVIIHVTCSSVVGYYFSKAYLLHKKNGQNIPFLRVFILGIVISIFLHLVYDVALSLGFSIVLFLYFIGGYLYVSSIFYREDEEKK